MSCNSSDPAPTSDSAFLPECQICGQKYDSTRRPMSSGVCDVCYNDMPEDIEYGDELE